MLNPNNTVAVVDYHGSDSGAIMVDRIIKDIAEFYPFLRERLVFTRGSFMFRPGLPF
jgi:hypothetical protein